MSRIPHLTTTSLPGVDPLVDDSIDTQADSITLEAANTDAGSSPTHWFRPGNVTILRSGTGEYVEATDANADSSTAPSITKSSAWPTRPS